MNLQGRERSLVGVGAVDSKGVNLGDVQFIRGVVGGGSTKSQGGKGESHGGAHVDLHVGLMLVEVELVCLFPFVHSGRRGT